MLLVYGFGLGVYLIPGFYSFIFFFSNVFLGSCVNRGLVLWVTMVMIMEGMSCTHVLFFISMYVLYYLYITTEGLSSYVQRKSDLPVEPSFNYFLGN